MKQNCYIDYQGFVVFSCFPESSVDLQNCLQNFSTFVCKQITLMATTKFYLDLRGNAKDGKGSILISIFHNKTTATIPTGIRVLPTEWDGDRIIKRSDSSILNAKLSKKRSDIDSAIAAVSLAESYDKMTATEIKRLVRGDKEIVDRHLVSALFDEYMTQDLSEGTRNIYRATRKKVLDYGGQKIKIESITVKWLYDFDRALAKTQSSANGRSIYLRSLRAVCKYAVRTGVIISCPFDNYQIKQEQTQKRSIELDKFREFMSFKTTVKNELYRDYFMLLFYLVGINTVDLLLAKKDCVINGRLEYDRQKTHKHYSIKIEPEAWEIINRHTGKGEFLLDAMNHCQHYRSFAHQMNDSLKEIGTIVEEEIPDPDNLFGEPSIVQKVIPVIPGISTYYARHSWATFAAELDISSDVIGQALGHSNANRTTMIYIKPNQSKIDAANRRVIDYVLGKGEISTTQ